MRVLSLAAPVFGEQLSSIFPLIISCMSPTEPSGFASTEVGAETSVASVEDKANDMIDTNIETSPFSRDSDVDERDKKMQATPEALCNEDRVEEGHSKDESAAMTSVHKSASIAVSKNTTIDDASDSVDSNNSQPSKKRSLKERDSDYIRNVLERIPKHQKQPFRFKSRVLAPGYKDSAGYESRMFMASDPFQRSMQIRTREERNRAYSMTAEQQRESISLKDMLHRYEMWQDCLEYRPTTRCIPTETYLVIIITCNGPSDAPFFLTKFQDYEEAKDSKFKEFLSIKKIIMIPRPLGDGYMYYRIPNLHKWLHGSLHYKSKQDILFRNATVHINDIVYVKPGQSYEEHDLGIKIIYQDRTHQDRVETPKIRELIPYVAHVMEPSSATARQVPCLSAGWSTANPNEYKRNRVNILGSISPFLTEGAMSSMEQAGKDMTIDLVCYMMRLYTPSGIHPHPFFHSDPNIMEMRGQLARQFLQKLGMTSHVDDEKYFRPEGIALIFNNYVPFHVDSMNDTPAGMNDTFAMNCQCIIGHELAGFPSIKKAMSIFKLDVGDPLSFSIVLYSRKVVGDYVKKQLRINAIKEALSKDDKHNLPECWWLLRPIIHAIERVHSDENTNAIWDDPTLFEEYMNDVKCDPENSQYQGSYITLTAGFDNMRYWSPLRYLVDALHSRDIIVMNCDNVMGVVCFSTFETNGTFLISAILEDVLCSNTSSASLFLTEYARYGLYAALIFAAQRRNVATDALYASSQYEGFPYTNRGTSDTFPIAGGSGLLSFVSDSDKERISERCQQIVASLADECYKLHSSVNDATIKHKKECSDAVARYFHSRIQEIGGPGVNHQCALNFIELASIFGFLPYEIVNWSCVGPKTSSVYKAINYYYKKTLNHRSSVRADLTEEEAEKHFKLAVKYITANVNWNFTASLCSSILSILYREMGGRCDVRQHDVMYFFNHRNGAMHHLYRWKMETPGKAILQVLLVNKDNHMLMQPYNLMEISRDGLCDGSPLIASSWKDRLSSKCRGVTKSTEYVLSRTYNKYFVKM